LSREKGEITSEQMAVLKSKGEGVNKVLSLKKTCEAIDAKVTSPR